jgi:hypothetical protein
MVEALVIITALRRPGVTSFGGLRKGTEGFAARKEQEGGGPLVT